VSVDSEHPLSGLEPSTIATCKQKITLNFAAADVQETEPAERSRYACAGLLWRCTADPARSRWKRQRSSQRGIRSFLVP